VHIGGHHRRPRAQWCGATYGSGRSQVLLLRCCCRRRALQLRSISKALVTWKPREATQERATRSEEAGPHGAHFLLPHQIGTIEALRPHLSAHLSWLIAQNCISTKRMANFFSGDMAQYWAGRGCLVS
jgi:hypothetical protein